MNKILHSILLVLTILWQLPQNLVGVVMLPFLGKKTLVSKKHFNYCFMGKKMSGGISLGNFSFVSPSAARRPCDIQHEQCGHVKQSLMLGPLYLFVIGIPSILHTFHEKCPCYYHFYTEKWANKLAHLEVEQIRMGYCRLIKKDETLC